MGWFDRWFGRSQDPAFVRVAVARHQPEGDLLLALLADADIPACYGRTRGFDVPDMMAAGPRDILVPEHLELDARAVLQPALEHEEGDPGLPGDPDLFDERG